MGAWGRAAPLLVLAAVGLPLIAQGEVAAYDGYDCQDKRLMERLVRQATLDPQAGGRIMKLELTCDQEGCSTAQERERLINLMDLCVGAPDDAELLVAAAERLKSTGLFSEVSARLKAVPGGSEVTFEAEVARTVRRISYQGTYPLLEADIEKRLLMRRGSIFSDDAGALRQQKEAIAARYEQEGYFGTKVEIIHTPVAGTNAVDVEVVVQKGKALEIERVVIGGHEALSYSTLRSILIEPIGWFGTFTDQKLKAGIDAVLDAYRQRGFYRTRIVDQHIDRKVTEGLVEIFIEIDEGPLWRLNFEGNERFTGLELAEKATFVQSGYVDKVEIAKTVDALRSLYETSGNYFATVEGREHEINDREREILFTIKEGVRSELRSITFEGNGNLDEEALRAAMSARAYGLFEAGGFLQRAELEADLGKIVAAYQLEGYLRATAPRWQLSVRNDGQDLHVKIFVEEGDRTLVRRVYLPRTPGIDREEIRAAMKLADGEPFNPASLNDDLGRLLLMYHARGYPRAEIKAACRTSESDWSDCALPSIDQACFERQGIDPLERCTPGSCGGEVDPDVWCCERAVDDPGCELGGGIQGDEVDVKIDIDEGPLMTVSEVFLRGNFETRDSVVRDELPLGPGDLLQLTRLYEGQSNLRGLGLFESVTIKAIGLDPDAITRASASNRVALVILVEELPSQFWDLRVGGESRDLLDENASFILTVETALVENNLLGLGRGLQLKLKAAVDALRLSDALGALDPDLIGTLDFLTASELVFFAPRSILLSSELSVTLFYTLDLLGVENTELDKEEGGARLTVRKNLSREVLEGLVAQISIEQRRFTTRSRAQDLRNLEGERLFSPPLDITKLTLNPSLDRRDSKLNPTRGYLLESSAELAADVFDSPTTFLKLSLTGTQLWTWFDTLTLAYGARIGAIVPLLDTETIPADELFKLGGANTVRGIRDDGVGPISANFEPRGGELVALGHLELRYPLLRSADLFGAAFLDSGLLVDCRAPVDFLSTEAPARVDCFEDLARVDPREDLRHTAGLGVRWLVLGQIPLLVDYGLLLNRRLGENFGDLHINVGYIF